MKMEQMMELMLAMLYSLQEDVKIDREGRKAEGKVYKEKMMAEWEAERKKKTTEKKGCKAGSHSRQDRRQPDETGTRNGTSREDGCQSKGNKEDIKTNRAIRAEMKAIQAKADVDRERVQEKMITKEERIETKKEAIQEMKDANLREIIVEMKNGRKERRAGQDDNQMRKDRNKDEAIQEMKDANLREIIVEIKDGRKERRAGQEATEVNLEKMETNPGEKEAVLEPQEKPNQEVAIHFPRDDRKETMSCQVTTAACLDSKEDIEPEVEHREVPMEEAAVKSSGTIKKQHKGRHLAAGRRREPKGLTLGDCGSRRKLLPPAERCPIVQQWHNVRETSSEKLGPRKIGDRRRNWPQPAGG
jgi:hypothetical protein